MGELSDRQLADIGLQRAGNEYVRHPDAPADHDNLFRLCDGTDGGMPM